MQASLRKTHPNLWLTILIAVFVHLWIGLVLLTPPSETDLLLEGPVFHIFNPTLWAVFSIITGLAMLGGIVVKRHLITQISAAVGAALIIGLIINSGYVIIEGFITKTPQPLAVKSSFGLLLFYLGGHIAFSNEPGINPANIK